MKIYYCWPSIRILLFEKKICISAAQNNKYLCDHDRKINFPFKRHFNKLTLSRKSEGGEI